MDPANSILNNQELIAKIKAQFGSDLRIVQTDDAEIILRPPTRVEWQAFRSMSGDKDKRQFAQEELSTACVVYPDRAAFEKLLERRPGLGDALSDCVGELAIGAEKIVAKKL